MTSRATALDGLDYFTAVRPIAEWVGVPLPSEAEIAARFAGADEIDIEALAADAVMLTRVVESVTGAVDTARDAHGALPDAWRGRVADAADAAVATHLGAADTTAARIRVVSRTVTAAADALARVRQEKYRTLSVLRSDHVGGQLISTVTREDADAAAVAIGDDISAAVGVFVRTMDIVDEAVAAILAALTGSFADLAEPLHHHRRDHGSTDHDPVQHFSGIAAQRSGDVGSPTAVPRPDIAAAAGGPLVDVTPLAAAASATATIAGAALAAASVTGMAVAGGLGSMMSQLIETVTDDDESGAPARSGRVGHPDDADHHAPESAAQPSSHQGDPVGSGGPDDVAGEPITSRPGPDTGETAARAGDAPREPARPAPVGRADDALDERAPDRDAPSGAPSRGARTDRTQPDRAPSAVPDPDDSGGLALAGDR